MKRFLKAFAIIGLITFLASCKKDDHSYTPPRDYNVQYPADHDSIVKYLKNHYMTVDADFNVQFDSITNPASQTSIWDQTTYPLDSVTVHLPDLAYFKETTNTPNYVIYYIKFRQGVGDKPTRGDDVLVSYRGSLLSDTQFDYDPYPQSMMSLPNLIQGWQEIMPLFNAGTYVDNPGSVDPAQYQNYGAGVMFVPSGLAYYNSGSGTVGSYQPLVFAFKLYAVNYSDVDGDGIENRYETDGDATMDIGKVDTDNDNLPNYLDTDDDGDGVSTVYERIIPGTNPIQYYDYDQVPTCTGGTKPKYLDPNCH